jgi:hypothetical protein
MCTEIGWNFAVLELQFLTGQAVRVETTGRGESRPRNRQFHILILLGKRNVIHDQPNPCLTGQKAPDPLQKHGET